MAGARRFRPDFGAESACVRELDANGADSNDAERRLQVKMSDLADVMMKFCT
jgi:hypothetical protein